jgi:hypothetical protein
MSSPSPSAAGDKIVKSVVSFSLPKTLVIYALAFFGTYGFLSFLIDQTPLGSWLLNFFKQEVSQPPRSLPIAQEQKEEQQQSQVQVQVQEEETLQTNNEDKDIVLDLERLPSIRQKIAQT